MTANDIFTYSLEQLDQLEGNNTLVTRFSTEDAWNLGSIARSLASEKYPGKAIVIDITLASNQVLFHTAINPGTAVDNDEWVNRKKRTVLRFGKSSFYIGQKLRIKKLPIEEAMFVSSREYASHGGSVPIKAFSVDGIVGALTVSGLAQDQDHLLAIEALKIYKSKVKTLF